jgi:hypothetical protein
MSDTKPTKWIFNRKQENGTTVPEEVKPERWAWLVVYKGGNGILRQFGDDGAFHQVGEIEQELVELFQLYKPEQPERRISLYIPEGARLVHKYKRYVFRTQTGEERRETVYVFGYKHDGRHYFYYIMPHDEIIFSNEELQLGDAVLRSLN